MSAQDDDGDIPRWGRKTFYNGIEMRSRLEATVARALDHKGFPWLYEPKCFADETGQYLPDFSVAFDETTLTYLETKGFIGTQRALRKVQEKMEIIWKSDRDASLMIWEGWPIRRQWTRIRGLPWHMVER